MMASPLISVIMPARNEAHYIGQAIGSIMTQTYRNWELIVVDDGSTDATLQIANQYAAMDPRIHVMHRNFRNSNKARNCAMAWAEGQYIAHHDADDFSRHDRLEYELSVLRSNPWQAVYCGMEIVDGNGRFVKSVPASEYDARRLMLRNYICGASVMHKRHAIERVGGWGQDIDWGLWLRMAPFGRFGHVPAPLYCYRIHGQNQSITRGWIGNRAIEVEIFERLCRRTTDPFARWKLRSLRCQMAIVKRIPGAEHNRYFLYALGKMFGWMETAAYRATEQQGGQR